MEMKYWVVGGVVLGVAGVVYYLNKSGAYATAPGAGMSQAEIAAQQAAMVQAQAQAQAQAQQPGMAPTMTTPMNFQSSFLQATPPSDGLPQSFRSPGLTPPTSSPGMPSTRPATQMLAPPPNLAATRMALKRTAVMPQPVPPKPAGPGFPGGIFPGGFPGFPIASAGSMRESIPWRMPSPRMPGPNLNKDRRFG